MTRRRSMRTALIFAFAVVATLPMILAAFAGILAFRDSMSSEAKRAAAEHMRIATAMAADRVQREAATLQPFASTTEIADALASHKPVGAALRQAAAAAGETYVLLVDGSGHIVDASTGGAGGEFKDEPVVFNALVGRLGGGFTRIDAAEMKRRGVADALAVAVTPTAGGTVHHKKVDGAMALMSAAPIVDRAGTPLGALVGVEVLNKTNGFVDDVTQRIGDGVTVFQDEVRVATSVRLANGDRAWGTVAPDPVQAQVLQRGQVSEGIANVLGKSNQAVYSPLRDGKGRLIGMLYVGFSTAPYDAALQLFSLRFLGSAALGLVLATFAGFALAATLSRPLAAIGAGADAVANRDLTATVPIDGTLETAALGEAFNTMVTTLYAIISQASGTATKLRGIAEDLTSQSSTQSDSADREASAVTETTATLEELAQTFASVAAGAEEVMRLAEDAVETAQEGQSTMTTSVGELERLFAGAERVAGAADHVAEASNDITGAIAIIESIAEQTKILALNAAIEAARAGEAGKGFAVVAAEIRQLADSVSDSTGRIEAVVRQIENATHGLTELSRDQNGLAERSVGLGQQAAGSFGEILDHMTATASAAREIAASAAQQRTATDQVVLAMREANSAAHDAAAAAREATASAERVREAGVQLDESLRGFRL